MDHRQFKMGRRIVDRHPPGLGERHDEQCRESHEMGRRIRHDPFHQRGLMDDRAEIGGAGGQRDGKNGEDHGRLCQRRHDRFPAAAHPTERRSGIEPREDQEKRSQRQEVHERDDVPCKVHGESGKRTWAPADRRRVWRRTECRASQGRSTTWWSRSPAASGRAWPDLHRAGRHWRPAGTGTAPSPCG